MKLNFNFLFIFFLIIISILSAVGLAELGMRIFATERYDYNFPLMESHDQFNHTLKHNYRGLLNRPEFSNVIEVNSFGFRDKNYPPIFY